MSDITATTDKRIAVSFVRVNCDNCLDHHGMVVVAYGDGEARTFMCDGQVNPKVAVRRVIKSHQQRGWEVVKPEPEIDIDVTFAETVCSTCKWGQDIVVLVDPVTLDHVVAA